MVERVGRVSSSGAWGSWEQGQEGSSCIEQRWWIRHQTDLGSSLDCGPESVARSWASYLASLSLDLLICKMEIMPHWLLRDLNEMMCVKHSVQSMEVVFVVINDNGGTEGTSPPVSIDTFQIYPMQ